MSISDKIERDSQNRIKYHLSELLKIAKAEQNEELVKAVKRASKKLLK